MAKKKALILGISGQDGSYLAELLLQKEYEVYGTTRGSASVFGANLKHLKGKIKLIHTTYDVKSLVKILSRVRPHEVFNFAGQTYVSKSWSLLHETVQSSPVLVNNILEAILQVDKKIRFFQASSCEIFSQHSGLITEESPIAPGNPYGCGKAYTTHLVSCFRQQYGIYAVTGIFFNHDSPRRHEDFVARKIVKCAVAIKLGREQELVLGNTSVARDWSYAPDIVKAAAKMMRMKTPQDLVLASGRTHSVQEMVDTVFALLELDPGAHVRIDRTLFRTSEAPAIYASSKKAKALLRWQPKTSFHDMLKHMVAYEIRLQTGAEVDFRNERPFAL